MRLIHSTIGIGILLTQPSCVSQGKYDAALADAHAARAQSAAATARYLERDAATQRLNGDLTRANQLGKARDEKLATLTASAAELGQKLDAATAMNQSLRDELTRLGQNVDKLLNEKGNLASTLAQARSRLEELRRAQAAAEARAALFRDLVFRFKKMVDSGELAVKLREGRMVLVLPNDVLFDSGKTQLKPAGKAALANVAQVLTTIQQRRFQVAGHTDDQPIQVSPFGSNWELSSARAVVVVNFLIQQGVGPSALSAAGYGEFDPVIPNDSSEGRARNRRIELVLQPNIDELVAVPTSAQ